MKKVSLIVFGVLAIAGISYWIYSSYFVEKVATEYLPGKFDNHLNLKDDSPEGKNPAFDPNHVDKRKKHGYEVNSSSAIIVLDCPDMKEDGERIFSNYQSALAASSFHLPSINLLDGLAKPVEDGLMASLDLAFYRGKLTTKISLPDFVFKVFQKLPSGSPARPFLAAALELSKYKNYSTNLTTKEQAKAKDFIAEFESRRAHSTPTSFYIWNEDLKNLWRITMFLRREIPGKSQIAKDLTAALLSDSSLGQQYQTTLKFYSKMTNPQHSSGLLTSKASTEKSFLPPATSTEGQLFYALFPRGAPKNANLMTELVRKIRSGSIDISPSEDSGWYAYQVHALESLLVPEQNLGNQKLLLMKKYKLRMLEAFKAVISKKRELHAKNLRLTKSAKPEPVFLSPDLRLEPNPSFYLRNARAYRFLNNFLASINKEGRLDQLHGLGPNGEREKKLLEELRSLEDRFYGFYLVCCDDIGLKPTFFKDETIDADRCYDLPSSIWRISKRKSSSKGMFDFVFQSTESMTMKATNSRTGRLSASAVFIFPPGTTMA